MELQEQLKHVYTYREVYDVLWHRPIGFDEMKKYLMQECRKPESTARSYITAIRGNNPGMIIVDEDAETMELDIEAVREFEKELECLFYWDEYDERHDKIEELEEELENVNDRIIDLEQQLRVQ